MKFLDRKPPVPVGDSKKDIVAIYNYLCYLQEQINYILFQLERQIGENNG